MTRTEFIRNYARRSSLSDEFAELGVVIAGGNTLIALPCACESDQCEGWAMLTANAVIDHLERHAPAALRTAYLEAVAATEAR